MIYLYIFLLAIPSYLIVAFIHEMGHWLFGIASGFEFRMFFLGPLFLEKHDGKIQLKFNRNIHSWPGAIPLQVKDIETYSRQDYIIMLLGGPLTSLIFGAVALMLYIYYVDNILVLLMGSMSLGIGLMTLIPLKQAVGVQYTDGRTAYALYKRDVEGENAYSLTYLIQCDFHNVIPEKKAEISERLEYMLQHRLEKDIIYIIAALSFIVEYRVPLLPKDEALAEMAAIKERASSVEKNWIDAVIKEATSS